MAEEIEYIHLKEIKCPNCAGEVQFDPSMQLSVCIHCGSKFEIEQPKDIKAIAPDGIVPFNLTLEQARNIFLEWLVQGNYTPDDILSQYSMKTFSGVYLPFYLFDKLSYRVSWSASCGYDRNETYTDYETRTTSSGRTYKEPVTKTRTVTDWKPSSGEITGAYSKSSLILATGKPEKMATFCESSPCAKDSIKTFHTGYILGFGLGPFALPEKTAYENRIKQDLNKQIDKDVKRDIPGDRQRDISWNGDIYGISPKKLYLPYWTAVYSYKGKQYRSVIDGQASSRISGEKPQDSDKKKKVFMFFLPLIIFLVLYAAIFGFFKDNILTSSFSEYVISFGVGVSVILAIVGLVRRSRLIKQSEKIRKDMLEKLKTG